MPRQKPAEIENPVAVARNALRLSREGLADQAHVSLKTIERIEAGQVTPRKLTRHAIAGALGCDPADLWPEVACA